MIARHLLDRLDPYEEDRAAEMIDEHGVMLTTLAIAIATNGPDDYSDRVTEGMATAVHVLRDLLSAGYVITERTQSGSSDD